MQWDTRAWSFFIFVIALIMYVAALATPYQLKAELVHYGPDDGLWDIKGDLKGFQWVTRISLIIGLVSAILSFVCYIVHFKRESHIIHLLSLISQLVAGILGVIGGAVYCANSNDIKGDGMWMSMCSGLIFIINSVVLACLPFIQQFVISHKSYTDDDALADAKIRSMKAKGTTEEKAPLQQKSKDDGDVELEVIVDPASPAVRNTQM